MGHWRIPVVVSLAVRCKATMSHLQEKMTKSGMVCQSCLACLAGTSGEERGCKVLYSMSNWQLDLDTPASRFLSYLTHVFSRRAWLQYPPLGSKNTLFKDSTSTVIAKPSYQRIPTLFTPSIHASFAQTRLLKPYIHQLSSTHIHPYNYTWPKHHPQAPCTSQSQPLSHHCS